MRKEKDNKRTSQVCHASVRMRRWAGSGHAASAWMAFGLGGPGLASPVKGRICVFAKRWYATRVARTGDVQPYGFWKQTKMNIRHVSRRRHPAERGGRAVVVWPGNRSRVDGWMGVVLSSHGRRHLHEKQGSHALNQGTWPTGSAVAWARGPR